MHTTRPTPHAPSPLPQPGTVTLVGAGPGDPELLTFKAVRAIGAATVLLVDDLVGDGVLAHASHTARIVHVGKRGGCRSTSQAFIEKLMIAAARAGEVVVRLKGGDPFIFGRGGEEIEALHRAGIAFKVIPGVSALNGATGAAGVALTSRGRNHGFAVVSAAPPTADAEFGRWAKVEGPVAIFMGVGRASAISREMIAAGRPADEPVTVIARGGAPDQRVEETTLAQLPSLLRNVQEWTPALIVVGLHREAAFKTAAAAPVAEETIHGLR